MHIRDHRARLLLAVAVVLALLGTGAALVAPREAESSSDSVLVAAVGDIACDAGEESEPRACQHEKTAAVVRALAPDLVLALGDLQYPSGASRDFAESYDRSWGAFKNITRPALGNHDVEESGGKGYFDYFGDRAGDRDKGYYSFDAGTWHIIALNTECEGDGCMGPGSEQERWLRDDLRHSDADCTLAMWHRPRFSSDTKHGDDRDVRHLWKALQDFDVDAVLAAHAHAYERFAPLDEEGRPAEDGIRSFVVGTGGKDLYPQGRRDARSEAAQDDVFGVLRLSLNASSYAWEFAPVDGADYTDSGSADCRTG